jgi:hypothetical protein
MSDRTSDHRLATSAAALLLAPAMMLVTGCGYMVGAPYEGDVRTVHVPTFTSDSFRRGLEFQLTEAVQKHIQSRTPFRLAKEPYADTRLTGNIALIRKSPLGESAFDDVRELQVSFAVEVTWEDLRTGQLLTQQQIPIAPEVVHLVSEAEFAPEVGQSLATANQQAIDRMARRIVEMMEMPW